MTFDKKVVIPASALGALAMVPTLALAEDATPTVTSTVSSMAGTIATDGATMITTVIPQIAPLVAAGIVAVIGFKLVKRFASKA